MKAEELDELIRRSDAYDGLKAEVERLTEALQSIDDHGRASSAIEMLKAQKAEIERLREENAHFAWRDKDKNKIITELCDALEWWATQRDYRPEFAVSLIQRARKATKLK